MREREDFPPVTITVNDYDRLAWIATAGVHRRRDLDAAGMLADELARANIVAAQAIPPSVATMHSRLEFRDEVTGTVSRITLVYPGEDDPHHSLHSVLTPVGAALIGLSEGQSIQWRTPKGGWRSLTLLRVLHQPERMADQGLYPSVA
jgi:regulator of nucleoside diphosphate kinase